MKAMSLNEACHLVAKLDPANWVTPSPYVVTQQEVNGWSGVLRSHNTLGEYLRTLDGTLADLATIREIMVAELTDKAREQIMYELMARHETSLRALRMQTILDHHPTLAVYMDKRKHTVTKGPKGAERLDAVSKAWPPR